MWSVRYPRLPTEVLVRPRLRIEASALGLGSDPLCVTYLSSFLGQRALNYSRIAWKGKMEISGEETSVAKVMIPDDASGSTVHIICEVVDDGTPVLTSYRRIIINVL